MPLKRICVRKENLKCPKIPHCPKIPVVTLVKKTKMADWLLNLSDILFLFVTKVW